VNTSPRANKIILYIVMVVFALFFLLPFYVLFATALKSFSEVSASRMWNLPTIISGEGFAKALKKLLPNLLNSFYLVIPATAFSAILGSLNGYVFSKWKFKGSDVIFPIILFGMFIPYQSILPPLVRFLMSIKLYGSIPGLILTHTVYGLPITTLIFRTYYTEVPTEVVEASNIDGAGILRTYWHIIFPISLPCFVVVIIWQFTNIWNEFLFAVVITSNPAKQPITVALVNLAGSQIVEWNAQMAGALLAALPPVLVYLLLGRYFLRGLLAGSVKG